MYFILSSKIGVRVFKILYSVASGFSSLCVTIDLSEVVPGCLEGPVQILSSKSALSQSFYY